MARKKRIAHVSRSFGGLFNDAVVAEQVIWPADGVAAPVSGEAKLATVIRVVNMTTGAALVPGTDYAFDGVTGLLEGKGAAHVGANIAVVYF